MQETQTNIESVEGQEKVKIILHFFRHDEKENDKTKSDTEVRLTEKGKLHAQSLADEETDLSQAIAFGSPRKRTQETAGLIMAGTQDGVLGTESLEDLKQKLDENFKYGTKLFTDKRLDFILPPPGIYYDEMTAAYKAGELLKYIIEKSDQRSAELGIDAPGVCAYSNQASQIAEILAKYFKVLSRFEQLVDDGQNGYKPTMERFLVSHQSVGESFLAKVIEKTKGVAERDTFVLALGNQGFGYAEGFNVEISTDEGGEEKAHITYRKEKEDEIVFEFDELVSREIIEDIILKK